MAKRIADKELTDRNWDQEDEGEEAGTFSVASEDVLKNRAMKKAKRRNAGPEGEAGGAFKGFKGFSLSSSSVGGGSTAFSGFGNGGGFKGVGALTNGSSSSSTPTFGGFSAPPTSTPASAPGLTFDSPSSTDSKQTNGSASAAAQMGGASGGTKEYRRQLTALNVSVRDWITKHVNDNPLCDLNPIFKDYERHLTSIERQYGAAQEKKQDAATDAPPAAPPSSSSSSSLFSFSKTEEKSATSSSSSLPAGVSFNFGQKVNSAVLASLPKSAPSFAFSSSSSSSSAAGPSLFGGVASPLGFGATKTDGAQPAGEENADEESEEPPKPEVKEVKEDDAFYSKKCKLFYKKEAEFKEKGVGTLHLKQTDDCKTQMIIRADTNLGNILLNVLLAPSMPCSRVGKNNVMVVCVPNPPVDDKNPSGPVPLLIRVKTTEDADELLKTLEEKKS